MKQADSSLLFPLLMKALKRCVSPRVYTIHKFSLLEKFAYMQIDGKRGAGRPKQTWKKLTEKDCREWKLTTVDPQERSTWRSGVRSAMRAASQLPGKGPTDVDDAPAPAC